ncbi:response regulator [Polaromonas glacialis]|uniref:response regulator n=1 Tax=Polaromonas glacialis TaxID=866564 RepID=UPI000496D63C|nr:response regulator [Polaromonas glacialis]
MGLVKHIIALHGGKVEAQSEGLGKGSVLTVTLPLIKKQPGTDTANHPKEVCPAGLAVRHSELPRLMIVDDNRDARQLLATLLEAKGYQVLRHESAESALADAALPGIEVFILDIGLPGMDGFELARRLRANPDTQGAVLGALTGYRQAHHRARGKAAGFDHYCVKPIYMHQLAALLAKLNT